MQRDMHNTVEVRQAITPRQTSAATAIVGSIIDRQGYASLEFALALGTMAAAAVTGTVLIEHSAASDLSGGVAVPDAELLGTEAAAGFVQTDDNVIRKIGYKGGLRYVRMTVTPASNNAALDIAAVAILGHSLKTPTP